MEHLIALARVFFQPVEAVFTSTGERQYWLYLVANLFIAAIIYLFRAPRWTLRGLVRYCLPARLFLHRSARADYKLWLLNHLILAAFAPVVVALAAGSYTATAELLRSMFGMAGLGWNIGIADIFVATVLNLIALDAGLFWMHYAHHRLPLLWEFHKVHHSAQVLTPFTVFRVHPLETFLNLCMGVTLAGITSGLLVFIYGTNPGSTVFGVNAFELMFWMLGYHLRHSHIWIMYPGWIGCHISSPALHMIHHSIDARHHDKNMAQMFTFWDRLTGTLYLPKEREHITFGIGHNEEFEFVTIADLYLRPIYKIAARWHDLKVRRFWPN